MGKRTGREVGKREAARLAALERLGAVRHDADSVLQVLVDDAREAFGTDLCSVNLVLPKSFFFKAWSGDLPEDLARAGRGPRERLVCRHVVGSEAPLVVEDFSSSGGLEDEPVYVDHGVRFYAGAPLVASDGHVVGSLCLLDARPREFGERDLALLRAFARAAVGRLETLGALERERAAREGEARRGRELGRILGSAAEGIVGLDPGGKIEFANPAAAATLGYEPGEIIGENMHRLVHHTRPDGTPYPIEECPNYLALGEGRERRSNGDVYWRKDGTRLPVEYASNPVVEGGKVVGAVVTFSDVTERKRAEEALEESEQRYRSLFEHNPDAVYSFDLEGRFLSANPACERLTGYTAGELSRMSFVPFIVPEDLPRTMRHFRGAAAGEPQNYEIAGISRDGRRVELEGTKLPVVVGGEVVGVYGIAKDVTERKEAEESLRESEARFRKLFENPAEALFVIHPETREVVDCNREACRSLGYPREELLGLRLEDFAAEVLPEEERARRGPNTPWRRALSGEPGTIIGFHENEHRRKDGTVFPVEVGVGSIEYAGGRMVLASARDATERKALEERLEHQAFHDPLTGLPNRALFQDRLEHALARAGRDGDAVAVLYLDLDDFKVVNDSLGHQAGDELLVEVAGRLRGCLRPGDTAARLGGDEFAVLLEGVAGEALRGEALRVAGEGEALRVAGRIGDALGTPVSLGARGSHEARANASVGVALSRPGQRAGDLLRNADVAMYGAKAGGKARHELFDPAMDERAAGRLEAENGLRRAIRRGEIVPFFQPKVSLTSGEVVGMEALARWEHPERGLVLPAEFIPLAEESGLIVPMGQAVLREACRRAAAWCEERVAAPPVAVWVNFSPKQFHGADVVGQVSGVLEETGLEAHRLGLEITEGVALGDAESTIETLGQLKELGVRIAIDDFGTGYSSLSYLKRFPVDVLKMDRSFVIGVSERPENLAIAQAIVTLGHSLDMGVVAEGVETEEELEKLRGLGCDEGQGYYFARPMPAEEAEALLASRRAR